MGVNVTVEGGRRRIASDVEFRWYVLGVSCTICEVEHEEQVVETRAHRNLLEP